MAFCTFIALALMLVCLGESYAMKQGTCTVQHLTNCGKDKGGSDFDFSWSPCDLTVGKTYKVSAEGTASRDFSSGSINMTVWAVGTPQPIFANEQAASCDMVKKLPFKFNCPVKKGDKLDVPSYSATLPKEFQIVPPGDYKVRAEILDNNKNMFICATGTITVTSSGENSFY